MLQKRLQPAVRVPAADHLRAYLAEDSSRRLQGSIKSIPRLIAFAAVPDYRSDVFDAVVSSIGGIDRMLSQTTANALVCIVRAPDHYIALRSLQNENGMLLSRHGVRRKLVSGDIEFSHTLQSFTALLPLKSH
jgi:hypothetical protein